MHKIKDIVPLVPTPPQLHFTHPSLVKDKGAFRAVMKMQLESRGDGFSVAQLNYRCH